MDLLSYFKRKGQGPNRGRGASAPPPDPESIRAARTRARRRLVGAMVLLGVGVVAFPLLFETQPRPIPVDLPIDIPRRESLPPLASPAPTRATGTVTSQPPEALSESGADPATAPALIPGDEGAPAAAATVATAPVVAAPASPSGGAGAVKPTPTPAATPASTPAPAPAATPPAPSPKPVPTPAVVPPAAPLGAASVPPQAVPAASDALTGRWVVQVGAFADVTKAREVRLKVERLGLKTYTQVVQTAEGRRIRVRVGPYGTRAEADRAAQRIKGGGLPSAVLLL